MDTELLSPDHHKAMLQTVSSQQVEPQLSAGDIDAFIRSAETAALSLKAFAAACKKLHFVAGDILRNLREQSLLSERVAAGIAVTTADAKIIKEQSLRKKLTSNN
jgi:hypothetical protein